MPCRKTALTLLLIAAFMPLTASAQFETRSVNSSVPLPYGAAVGDLNHDGKIDLVVSTIYPNSIAVMLGNGDGTFSAPVTYTVPNNPDAPVLGDFNGDGNLDVAVTDSAGETGSVVVFLGNGDGTFRPGIAYTTQPYSCCAQVGDFNNDGKLDLIVSGFVTFGVLLGNGDGTFQEPAIVSIPPGEPIAFAVGDFNHDGKLDLVTMINFETESSANVMLGNGDGTFSLVGAYPVPSPASVTVADLNHDQNLDLVVTNGAALELSVLLGNGDGSFQATTNYPLDYSIWAAVADFNGDGIPDIAAADFIFPAGLTVFTGNGNGTFGPGLYYPVGDEDRFVTTGDFNGDGQDDLLVPSFDSSNVAVLLNTGTVRFSPTTPPTFRGQVVGTSSPWQTVTFTNMSKEDISISSISLQGEFVLKTTCGSSLPAGETCSIRVSFDPKSPGEKSGLVSIMDSASVKPQVIDLSGQATVVQLSPTQIAFGSQKVGSTSAPQQIQIRNTGDNAIAFSRVIINGNEAKDFSQTNNCPALLAPGASCEISVTFSPTKRGPRSATLEVIDSGGASPQTTSVSGTGS